MRSRTCARVGRRSEAKWDRLGKRDLRTTESEQKLRRTNGFGGEEEDGAVANVTAKRRQDHDRAGRVGRWLTYR